MLARVKNVEGIMLYLFKVGSYQPLDNLLTLCHLCEILSSWPSHILLRRILQVEAIHGSSAALVFHT